MCQNKMCIMGCSIRMRLSDYLALARDNKKSLSDLKDEFTFEEFNVPEDYVSFTENLNIFRNDSIFQGTLVYATGTAKNPEIIEKELDEINMGIYSARTLKKDGKGTFRPTSFSFVEKGEDNYNIKIALVFSPNKFLRGYLYNFEDTKTFVLEPSLTRKFIKLNKSMKELDFIEDFQVIYLGENSDFTQESLDKINQAKLSKKGTVILHRDKKTFEEFIKRIEQIIPNDELIVQRGLE